MRPPRHSVRAKGVAGEAKTSAHRGAEGFARLRSGAARRRERTGCIPLIVLTVVVIAIVVVWTQRSSAPVPAREPTVALKYTILRQWLPDNTPNGYGAELLLEQDVTEQELILFLKRLGEGKDPVLIKIYTTRKAYEEELSGTYTTEYDRGYLLSYIRKRAGRGAYARVNEIRWMQKEGPFSHLYGQTTPL